MKRKHTKYTQINTNKSTHSEIDPVWQNPIQRTVRTAHLSVLITIRIKQCCTVTVASLSHQLHPTALWHTDVMLISVSFSRDSREFASNVMGPHLFHNLPSGFPLSSLQRNSRTFSEFLRITKTFFQNCITAQQLQTNNSYLLCIYSVTVQSIAKRSS